MFKKPLKKKVPTYDNNNIPDSTMGNHPYKMSTLEDRHSVDYNSDNQKKNISWRSPLVFSPGIKFSPNASERGDNETQSDSHNVSGDTTSSRSSKHLTTHIQKTPKRFKADPNSLNETQTNASQLFPLSDKDCNISQNMRKPKELDNIEKFSDIFSSQILGFKNKETNSSRILTKRDPESACDYYVSETSKLNKKETKRPKKDQNRNIEETDENEINLNAFEGENFYDFPEDEIISQNRSQSQTYVPRTASEEYIDTKIRKNYPVYPGYESPSTSRYLPPLPPPVDCRNYDTWPNSNFRCATRATPNAIHYSSYVNPIHPDLQQSYEPMHSLRYGPRAYGMRPFVGCNVGQYGNVDAGYGGGYQYELNPQMSASRRSFSPNDMYEGRIIPKTIPSATPSRHFYRTPDVIQDDLNNSYVVPDPAYPVGYNQNVASQVFFPRSEHNVPYGFIPEYPQSQDADKDYVMSNYWHSLNRE